MAAGQMCVWLVLVFHLDPVISQSLVLSQISAFIYCNVETLCEIYSATLLLQ